MFNLDIPERPDRSLKLYEAGNNWMQDGYVYKIKSGSENIWHMYASGYLEATIKLIEIAKKEEFTYDTFGYPIFYLFSHYLELRMKDIINTANPLIGEAGGYPKGHNLNTLWETCKEILKGILGWDEYKDLGKETREDYETIDRIIKKIAMNEQAQQFRYPVDTSGKPFLAEDSIHVFNIDIFSDVVDWLSMMIEGFSSDIDEYWEHIEEGYE